MAKADGVYVCLAGGYDKLNEEVCIFCGDGYPSLQDAVDEFTLMQLNKYQWARISYRKDGEL
jgi:hypothetical protein